MKDLSSFAPAFAWAKSEMEGMFPDADRVNLNDLDQRVEKYGAHLSVFVNEDESEAILRAYWSDGNRVKYSHLENYTQLRTEKPAELDQLLRNGVYAYMVATDPAKAEEIYNK